uniref:CNH domain-containing protein n=1 Tax=Elaeophora elaphi TaxID=1147741 RepID=A0A0R3RG56_9BILA
MCRLLLVDGHVFWERSSSRQEALYVLGPATQGLDFMFRNQKDTVDCVAAGNEEFISAMDVYEMSQTKNKQYRWKHAFQFPTVFAVLPNRSHYLKINPVEKGKFDARVRVDCAETAVKLETYAKKYIATFEENSMDKISAAALEKKRLQKQSDSHSMNNVLLDVTMPP